MYQVIKPSKVCLGYVGFEQGGKLIITIYEGDNEYDIYLESAELWKLIRDAVIR